jgi:hypothetical protein
VLINGVGILMIAMRILLNAIRVLVAMGTPTEDIVWVLRDVAALTRQVHHDGPAMLYRLDDRAHLIGTLVVSSDPSYLSVPMMMAIMWLTIWRLITAVVLMV